MQYIVIGKIPRKITRVHRLEESQTDRAVVRSRKSEAKECEDISRPTFSNAPLTTSANSIAYAAKWSAWFFLKNLSAHLSWCRHIPIHMHLVYRMLLRLHTSSLDPCLVCPKRRHTVVEGQFMGPKHRPRKAREVPEDDRNWGLADIYMLELKLWMPNKYSKDHCST